MGCSYWKETMKVDESLRAWYSSYATLMIIGLSTNWRNSESLLRGYPINETQWQSTRTSNMEGLQKTRSPTSPSHVFSARLYAASRVLSAKVSQRSHWQEGVLVTIGTIIRQHKFVRWHGEDCQLTVEPQAQSPSRGGTERQLVATPPPCFDLVYRTCYH
jgi:hypothetical protein